MKKLGMMAGMVVALVIPAAALASTAQNRDVTLSKGDNRSGTYYVSGQTVTIDGNVDGDVACAGQTVTINGSVSGDVLCAGQTITINGPVAGSVRTVSQVLTVNGSVGRNVTAAAQNLDLGSGAKVSGEVALAGQTVNVGAPIEHAAYVAGDSVSLASTIGGSFTGALNMLQLKDGAHITGNFDYTSDQQLDVDKGKVDGQIAHHLPPQPAKPTNTAGARLASLIYAIAAALVGALLAVWLVPRLVRSVSGTMTRRWQASLGWGVLALVAGPILLAILAVTIIGAPTAAVVFMLWLAGIFSATVFTGVTAGRLTWQRDDVSRRGLILAALVGVPMVVIAAWLPVIGGIIGFGLTAWALGGLLVSLNEARAV